MCTSAQLLQLCLTLYDPIGSSLPGSSVHGIFQPRILEWVAMPHSRDLPDPGIEPVSPASPAIQADSLLTEQEGRPHSLLTSRQLFLDVLGMLSF